MTYYFNKIEICEAYHLRYANYSYRQKMVVVSDYMPFQPLPLVGMVNCECTESHEKGTLVHDIKLTAKLSESVTLPERPCVLRLTDIFGNSFMMGDFRAPHPELATANMFGKSGEAVGTTFSAKLHSLVPLLKIHYPSNLQ